MLVITLTDCPRSLRGDLTRWLFEIGSGVYTGHVSSRVRDALWERIVNNVKKGRVTMVYSAKNEQRLIFRVHNSDWQPVDYDGLLLMLRPDQTNQAVVGVQRGFSNVAKRQLAKRVSKRMSSLETETSRYVVIDFETTGLSALDHEIIEIGAIRINKSEEVSRFHALVKASGKIPSEVQTLTGISDTLLSEKGVCLKHVLEEFICFIGQDTLVSHNTNHEMSFLSAACDKLQLPMISNKTIDTAVIARQLIDDVVNYKLQSLADYFGIANADPHRSISDCVVTHRLFEKLIEIQRCEN